MKIRKASHKDLPAIKTLIKQYPKQLLQSLLPKPRDFFVAEQSGQVVGCCALEVYSKRLAEIRSLVVAKEFQRQGVATKLIETCITRAKAKGVLEVLSITGAIKLFKKNGFRVFNQEKYAMLRMLKK